MNAVVQFFKTLWRYWKKFGQFMGDMVGRVVLMLFYITVALPFGLGVRLFGNPLNIGKKATPTGWVERAPIDESLAASHNQF